MPATYQDADIVLRLYDMRREAVMRSARKFMAGDFWPQSAADVLELAHATGTERNAFFRQVVSWCEMCCSLPLRGAVDPELFADWNREIFFVYAKFRPFLAEVREKYNAGFLGTTEKFVTSRPEFQQTLTGIEARVNKLREARAGKG